MYPVRFVPDGAIYYQTPVRLAPTYPSQSVGRSAQGQGDTRQNNPVAGEHSTLHASLCNTLIFLPFYRQQRAPQPAPAQAGRLYHDARSRLRLVCICTTPETPVHPPCLKINCSDPSNRFKRLNFVFTPIPSPNNRIS